MSMINIVMTALGQLLMGFVAQIISRFI